MGPSYGLGALGVASANDGREDGRARSCDRHATGARYARRPRVIVVAFVRRRRDDVMIEIRIRARFDTALAFVTVRRRGTLYDLGGEVVELFTVKVLAEALDRSRDTILEWERRGDLPRPLFHVERRRRFLEDGPWRVYSSVQVVNANRLTRLHFGDRRRIDDPIALAAFVTGLRAGWYRPALVPDGRAPWLPRNQSR